MKCLWQNRWIRTFAGIIKKFVRMTDCKNASLISDLDILQERESFLIEHFQRLDFYIKSFFKKSFFPKCTFGNRILSSHFTPAYGLCPTIYSRFTSVIGITQTKCYPVLFKYFLFQCLIWFSSCLPVWESFVTLQHIWRNKFRHFQSCL